MKTGNLFPGKKKSGGFDAQMRKLLMTLLCLWFMLNADAQGVHYEVRDSATNLVLKNYTMRFTFTSGPVSGSQNVTTDQSGWLFVPGSSSSCGKISVIGSCPKITSGNVTTCLNGSNQYIKVRGGKAQLMARDGFDDAGIEPNPSGNIWQSPDLWNRRDNTGNTNDNQDPGYGSGGSGNLMRIRIKNIGCVASDPSYVRLYWTLGATGEHWPGSWNGTTTIGFLNKVAGDEITTTSTYGTYINNGINKGYQIPALQLGIETIVQAKWFPPDPAGYVTPTIGDGAMICFLGRIDDPLQDPMYSELSSSSTSTGRNIGYNNNIVTRNSKLVNLPGSFKLVPRGGTILVNNYLEESALFNIRFRALDANDAKFADLGKTTLKLGETLWAAWEEAGQIAEGVEISNYEAREVTVTDLSNVVFKNINIPAGEFMGIGASFELSNTTDVKGTYNFGFSQEKAERGNDEDVYGSECVFIVTVNGVEEENTGGTFEKGIKGNPSPITENTTGTKSELLVYPNPSNDKVTIQFKSGDKESPLHIMITDMSGRIIRQVTRNAYSKNGQFTVTIDTKNIPAGTYTISLQNKNSKQSSALQVLH